MPLKIAAQPTIAPPPIDPTMQVDAFRAQWRVVRSLAREQSKYAGHLIALENDVDFHECEMVYKEMFLATYSAVQWLIGLATRLSPEAKGRVEAGVGPLFTECGALTPWWKELWISEQTREAARIRARMGS